MFYFLLAINFFSFIIYRADKRKAEKHERRISEKKLLAVSFFGGTLGAFLAMVIFRHKISKTSFVLKFGCIVLIQVVFIYLFENAF
ncbi:DUF1294 domain-containing protein [Chryseobacterium gambrini]|uniref:DUF1294 domain-containing protein n=1 Tax=Chryseobacterium gambrini TaxID=373672 RepID=A0AAJ1VKT6_9FLAO|nr:MULTISPECIES: DUF1294 domain-containing protein [Chryseobacterium]MDN4013411.1 DUF1294 domain-containing protein [Chryseobacterium gambrini]MDN4031621.1 DUF1294 domain-containing protein [Chryseobacterium gambrini]QWA39456.1 DUF1294 domain-containing protein [Chryseobacterium sp. ZHDP1]